MKPLLALYFFILAAIQFGLLAGFFRSYKTKNLNKPSPYWMGSLTANVLGLTIFGIGILANQSGAVKPEFNFTIANSLFYISGTLQLLFCWSLNTPISRNIKTTAISSTVVFIIIFEWMRISSSFELRTTFLCVIAALFYALQIFQLKLKRNSAPYLQLTYLQYVTGAELFFSIGRIVILSMNSYSIQTIGEVPQILVFFTIAQLVMNTLAYIAIGAYWTELMVLSNVKILDENQEIKALLLERECLIRSLLKLNKTASTGALSASIAHELNQPLGASQLNIQFLQKKLMERSLTPEQNQEILAALLADNQRAANIIQSLKSIFSESKIRVEKSDINELIESVLRITRPEMQEKNIQVILKLDSSNRVNINRSEVLQVLLNLINNAIQGLSGSTSSSKTIQIQSLNVNNGVELLVADNGPGIDAQKSSQLFELLGESNKPSGMGLGLWLCRYIVSRHGGHINYAEAPGGGALFRLTLPFVQD